MLKQTKQFLNIRTIVILCINILAMGHKLNAQTGQETGNKNKAASDSPKLFVLRYAVRNVCKGYHVESIVLNPFKSFVTAAVDKEMHGSNSQPKPVPFLDIHGNIAYAFDYRSRLDTPFSATNLQQHTEVTYADATLKGKYPFRVILTSRQSNSPYFKNYSDVNVQFNHQQYEQLLKQSLISDLNSKLNLADSIRKYQANVNAKQLEYDRIKNWLNSASLRQDIVQEKEALYQKYQTLSRAEAESAGKKMLAELKDTTSLQTDSMQDHKLSISKDSILALLKAPTSLERIMKSEEQKMDSIGGLVKRLQHTSDSVKSTMEKSAAEETTKIKNAKSLNELEAIAKKNKLTPLNKTDRKFLAVTQFGIGRGVVSYSDLTVNNISLSGLNVEYNPSFYAAFAVGSVDYLFRDFIVNPIRMPKQKLLLGRYGWGAKDNRIIILTAYTGTKNTFGGTTTDTVLMQPAVNSYGIFGYSLETRYKIGNSAEASLEYAKSSAASTANAGKKDNFGQAFNFSDRSNEAFSAKINVSNPSSGTTVNMYYKLTGANFNSFSIYNSGIRQTAWGIKWKQYFFNGKLSLTAQVKKSSFEEQFIPLAYNTSTIFKNFQAVYRKRKWPVISLGYMPSTQLVKNANNYIFQNVYYALTGSLFYNYSMLKLRMNSNLVYNRFFNKGTDSGFVLYNAKSIQYSHFIDLNKWHSQSDVQYTMQPLLTYWTFQQKLDVRIGKTLVIGAGVKNNLLPAAHEAYWGGSALIGLQIPKFGLVRMQYDKGYFPNGMGGLVPNNWGRITWNKIF